MNAIPEIRCPECQGKGRVRLCVALTEALSMVRYAPGQTAPCYAKRNGMKPTAWNNRLTKLARLGLIRGEKHGVAYKWFPK